MVACTLPPHTYVFRRKLLPTTSCCCCYCCPSRPKPIQKFTCQDALILLQKCANFNQLKLIHAKIIRQGLSHSHDQLLVRNLLRLCSSYAQLDYATHVFHQIKQPSSFTWNLMIRSLATNAKSKQALLLYNSMLSQGYPPDKFTFPFVVKACIASFANHKGKEVHGLAIKTGFYARDLFVQNTLMDLYFKCGDADSGRMVFDKMRVRNVVSWTTMLTGLVACGDLDAARWVFDQMPTRNVVSWSAMVNAYVTNQQPQEAFQLFHRMQIDNVRPNEFTLVSLLKACTHLDSLELGTWIHDFAINAGFQLGVFLGTALIDMYSKCGSLEYARLVFDKMQVRNLATWNSMITSLGVHGYGEEALALFAQMEMANVQPDAITFVGVLSACVHTNNIDEGYRYFGYMTDRYGITPILEHYSCMIELYSRADMLDEVHKLVKSMPVKLNDDSVVALIKPSISKGVTDMEGATV